MSKKMKIGSMVRVEWVDSVRHIDGWIPLREAQKLARSVERVERHSTVGFLMRHSDKQITVALNWACEKGGNYPRVSDAMSIPMSCVSSIRKLRH